jgi:hypothetical protein
MAINSMPPAMINEFFSADQKSGSLKMKRKAPTPNCLLASKKGVSSKL